ncbi:hypothetical protein FDP41_004340 [Naegleria fowleri]|uniref:Right handed beta helix domain-containing protein n=1 Tax=Naegleria fowleri TaxID=5763 RepID=A0A6A5BQD7_NAEFO|nr:uncharacterized protein FDP41_004340 [Naegleria fowleri]KAF0976441.1 hypothetical protein FDP41_004340 [Naegleria fowleri]
MNDSNGNTIYGREQCTIDVDGYFQQVTITSLSVKQMITLDCDYKKLAKHLGVQHLSIIGVKLQRMNIWLAFPTISIFEAFVVDLNQVHLSDNDMTSIDPPSRTLSFSQSSIKNSTISVQNRRWIKITSSNIANSTISSKIASKISLSNCRIENFQFTVDDRILALRQQNIYFSIINCQIIHTIFIIYEFNNTIFDNVQFYGSNIVQHLFSYETTYSRVSVIDKANIRFHGVTFVSLIGCTFSNLEAFDQSNKYLINVETISG